MAPKVGFTLRQSAAIDFFCRRCNVYVMFLDLIVNAFQGKQRQFLDKLMMWIKEHKFAQVVILTSSHARYRTDSQLIG